MHKFLQDFKSKRLAMISKIIDQHIYLLITLDGKILRGLFEHKRLKLANIRTLKEMSKTLQN